MATETSRKSHHRASRVNIAAWAAVLVGVVGAVIAVLTFLRHAPNSVAIIDPAPQQHVTRVVEARGTAKLASDSQLWVFVWARGRRPQDSAFYPQTDSPVVPDAAGRWKVRVYVGATGTTDDHREFTIIARISSIDDANAIERAVARNAPVPTVPGGSRAQSAVTVVRVR